MNFGKSVSDNGWWVFTNMLNYKLAEQGKQLVKIARFSPSGKMCSAYSAVRTPLGLSERECVCEACGHKANRDIN